MVVLFAISATPTADMLNGFRVDERLTCSCNGAPRTLLTDALGSAIALTDANGSVQTEYTYDPFGSVSVSGTSSTNSSQFTGRENDSTGLHYYRARYYSPTLQRFISEDPIGLGGGDTNFYAYVGNSPTNFTDPSGNSPLAVSCLPGAIIGVAFDLFLAGRKVTLTGLFRSAAVGCVGGLIGFGLGKLGLRALSALQTARAARTPLALPAARQFAAKWGVNTYRHGGQMSAIEHINYRHAFNSGFKNVSRFAERTSMRQIRGYVDDALRYGNVTPNGPNGFQIDHGLRRVIGTDGAGKAATGIRVFLRDGNIQTAFPIP